MAEIRKYHQFLFLPNYRFCKEFCQTAKWAFKLKFYVPIFWEIHFWKSFIVICLPICNLDVKNEHLIIRKMIIVADWLLCPTRVKGPFGAQYARPLRGRIVTCFALSPGALHLAFSLFNICPTLPSPFNDLPYRV